MSQSVIPHGDGVRLYNAYARRRATLSWRGGAVELIERSLTERAEVRLRVQRHAIFFTYAQPKGWSENTYDNCKLVARELVDDNTVSILPAGGDYYATGAAGFSRYLAIFLDRSFMLAAGQAEHIGGCQLLPSWSRGDPTGWALAEAIRAECEAGAPHGTLYAETMATALSVHLLRHHSNLDAQRLKPARGGLSAWQLRQVCEYLDSHLADDITLAELAALVDLSPAHFCRAFKASTGRTITRWRTERRIAFGKELLADPRLPITDIALACGFSDHSHFGKVFREQVGVAPSVWRREWMS